MTAARLAVLLALVGCGGGAFSAGDVDAGDAGTSTEAAALPEASTLLDVSSPLEADAPDAGADVEASTMEHDAGDPCAVDTSSAACAAQLVDTCCREHIGGLCCLARAPSGAYAGSTPCAAGSFACAAGSCADVGHCAPMDVCWYGNVTSSDGAVSYADVGQVVLCE